MNELFTEIQNAAKMIASPNYADILSVILSSASIIISAIVALVIMHKQNNISKQQAKISEQQNNISLFKLRYDVRNHVFLCYQFAVSVVEFAKKNEDLYRLYCSSIKNDFLANENEGLYEIYCSVSKNENFALKQKTDNAFIANEIKSYIAELDKARFLFPRDISVSVDKLFDALLLLVRNCVLLNEDYLSEGVTSLQMVIKEFENKRVFGQMAQELYLAT